MVDTNKNNKIAPYEIDHPTRLNLVLLLYGMKANFIIIVHILLNHPTLSVVEYTNVKALLHSVTSMEP